MPAFLLTELKIKNAKPGVGKLGQPIPRMLNDGLGLMLRVAPSGSKSWIYRYRVGPKLHDMGLGSYDPGNVGKGCTLAQAREKAAALRRERQKRKDDGTDPVLPTRKSAPQVDSLTFRQAALAWIAAKEAAWSDKHRLDITASLTIHAFPMIGDMPIGAVDTAAIMRVIEPKWLSLTETMSRVRSRIESVIGYAVTKGLRSPGDNPARWEKHLENLLPDKSKVAKPENFSALDWQDMPGFMVDLRRHDGLIARALEFTILAAARTNETVGATWAEFDLEGRVWTIPAGRMKMRQEHRVPLSEPLTRLLAALPREGDYLFRRKDGGQLVGNSMIRLLDAMKVVNRAGEKVTVHGFRATFKSWALDNDKPQEIVEMAMAHKNGDKVAAAYTRTDLLERRRQLAAAWGRFCDGETETANVVPLRGLSA
jgi:integrase